MANWWDIKERCIEKDSKKPLSSMQGSKPMGNVPVALKRGRKGAKKKR